MLALYYEKLPKIIEKLAGETKQQQGVKNQLL
jgi:hypothetical protein